MTTLTCTTCQRELPTSMFKPRHRMCRKCCSHASATCQRAHNDQSLAHATQNHTRWTQEEDSRLIELAPRHTKTELAALLGRTYGSIAMRLSTLRTTAKRHTT